MKIESRKIISRLVNGFLHPVGLRISRLSPESESLLSRTAMSKRLIKRNIPISTVIDVGASDGRWSKFMMHVYPGSKYLLVEANPIHRYGLDLLVGQHSNCMYTLAVAGASLGTVFFDDRDPLGGTASLEPTATSTATFPSTTIDHEVVKRHLHGPFLLKLDTHGFELPIFEGAMEVLRDTHLIIVETYNFDLTGNCLRFWEMCSFLESKGFLPIDLLDPMFRPKDAAFWQVDIVFAKRDRPEFLSNSYR